MTNDPERSPIFKAARYFLVEDSFFSLSCQRLSKMTLLCQMSTSKLSYFNVFILRKTFFSPFQQKLQKNTLSPHCKRLFFL